MRFNEFNRPRYKTTVEIEDDLYVGVNYNLQGQPPSSNMSMNKNNYLLDQPKITNIQVFDLDTDLEITAKMSALEIDRIKDSIECDMSIDARGY